MCRRALFITKVTGELVINDATSQLRPVTRICLLSFIIDSVSMKRLLPEDKLEEIVSKKPISILPRRRFLLLERQHMLLEFLCQFFQLFLQSFVVL